MTSKPLGTVCEQGHVVALTYKQAVEIFGRSLIEEIDNEIRSTFGIRRLNADECPECRSMTQAA